MRKVLNPDSETFKKSYEDFIGDYGYNADNRLLFFFSGHGYSRSGGTKGYLVPADAPVADPRTSPRDLLELRFSTALRPFACSTVEQDA